MNISMPQNVEKIIKILNEHSHEAYAVGGCVRDSILGREPEDWDITTSAKPWQVKEIFHRTIDTGIAHGTVTVMIGKEGYEVTTYRIDGNYEDSRHPDEVIFTRSLIEDLKRRDFTINAMAYNYNKGLVDAFDGKADIDKKIIRCVGIAEERFTEDALRILRAVRFSAQLGFAIEGETLKGIAKLSSNLQYISEERIQSELVRLMVSPYPAMLLTAYEAGITSVILPEFDRLMEPEGEESAKEFVSVGNTTLLALQAVPANKYLRLAVLFTHIGKPSAKQPEGGADTDRNHSEKGAALTKIILERLKFDNETKRIVTNLVRYYDYNIESDKDGYGVRKAIYHVGDELFPMLLAVKAAYLKAAVHSNSEKGARAELDKLCIINDQYKEILEGGQCVSLKNLQITGSDLIELGMRPGKEIGEILHILLEQVLKHPEYNKKEKLISIFTNTLSYDRKNI